MSALNARVEQATDEDLWIYVDDFRIDISRTDDGSIFVAAYIAEDIDAWFERAPGDPMPGPDDLGHFELETWDNAEKWLPTPMSHEDYLAWQRSGRDYFDFRGITRLFG